MAGVQIPRTNRLEPQAPQSVGRLEVSVPNFAEAAAPATRGVESGLKSVLTASEAYDTAVKKQRATAIDIKSTDEANQFEYWSKEKLSEIKSKEGDTTADYIEYEKQAEAKYKEVFSKYGEMDDDFKTLLNNKLNTTYSKQSSFRNIQQSEQQYKWRGEVVNNTVKLAQDSFFQAGERLDIKNNETFANLNTYAKDMIQSRLAHADQIGTLTRKADGTPDFETGPVSVLIKKDIGDAVIPLVTSLNAAGKVKEGKKVIEQYSPYLNAADKAKLISDNNESDVRNQAINKLADLKLQTKKDDLMLSDIDAAKDISEPIRFKMKELNQIESVKKTQERDRIRENFMDSEYNRLITKQTSVTPYATDAEYIDSPEGKNAASTLAPEQFERMRKVAFAPVKSTAAALTMLNDGDKNGNLYKMSAENRVKMYAGLSNEDRGVAREVMRQQSIDAGRSSGNAELTGSTATQAKSSILKNIEEQLQANDVFEYNTRRKTFGNDEYVQKMLKQYSSVIQNDILMAGKKAGDAGTQDTIMTKRLKQMVNQYKKDQSDSSWFSSHKFKGVSNETKSSNYPFDGSIPKPKAALPPTSGANKLQPSKTTSGDVTTATPVVTAEDGLPAKNDRKSWNKIYRQVKGTAPTNVDDFNKFIDDTIKNK